MPKHKTEIWLMNKKLTFCLLQLPCVPADYLEQLTKHMFTFFVSKYLGFFMSLV